MNWFLIFGLIVGSLFFTLVLVSCLVVGGSADRRDEEMFDEWKKRRDSNEP